MSVYIDDILVTGRSPQEHVEQHFNTVLLKMETAELRLKKSKCVFMSPSEEYLGYRIDKDGLHPTDDKMKAVKDAPLPKNATELRSFLGLMNYYGKFLPNLSSVLAPLYELLKRL